MTPPDSREVQQAIDFLSNLDPREVSPAALPPRPDVDALVRIAEQRGLPVRGAALREGFRIMMRARLLASRIAGRASQPQA